MKKWALLKAFLLLLGLAVSLFLAIGGASIEYNLGIRTPGTIASEVLVPPRAFPHALGAVGDGLRVQMFVDWVFWFAVLYLVYFVIRKLFRSLAKRQSQ
jgi:hypothetical protein